MALSIENLKGEITRGGGLAKGNQFRVILPIIPEIYLNQTGLGISIPSSMNVLCKAAQMPGRQLLTNERTIGVVNQKVVYGSAFDETSLSFIGLNDYLIRKYFEDWQNYALDDNTHIARYKNEYAKTVTIQQLDHNENVVYAVDLLKAFPTQIIPHEYTNELNTFIDINVTLSYTKWKRSSLIENVVSGEINQALENLILRN